MSDLQKIIATVDVAIFTIDNDKLSLVMTRRQFDPEKGRLSLPGGYIHVDEDEDCVAAARRILKVKTGLDSPYLEQLYTYSGGKRDPRGWSITVSYYALVPIDGIRESLIAGAEIVAVEDAKNLPFDHDAILETALERLRNKSTYSTLPLFLLPREFTLPEMQKIYEVVIGTTFPTQSFRRKIEAQNIIVATDYVRPAADGASRPATLYKLKKRKLLEFDRKV